MPELLVAGGTGQEVALSVLRLCYLLDLEIPRVWVLDSDVAPAEAKGTRPSRTQALQALDQQLRSLGVLDSSRLRFVNPTVLPNRTTDVHTIENLFGSHGFVDEDEKLLLELVLDPKQRQTPIHNGFHGQPAVGALAIAAGIERGLYDGILTDLRQAASTQQGLRVVLAASIAGGTGTSVLPTLARTIRSLEGPQGGQRPEIVAVLQAPWFKLVKLDDDPQSRPPDVDTAAFDRNASCLLRGYVESAMSDEIDRIVLLGLPETVSRVSQGGQEQVETLHYLCLIAGISATNLLTPQASDQMLGEGTRGFFGLGLAAQPSHAAYGFGPGGTALFLGKGRTVGLGEAIRIARDLVTVGDAIEFEIRATLNPSLAHQYDVARLLRQIGTPRALEDFRAALRDFTNFHRAILEWLSDSLRSMIGANRADTLDAFPADDAQAELLAPSPTAALKDARKKVSFPPLGRRVLQALGPFRVEEGASGRNAAWAVVTQARGRLIDQLASSVARSTSAASGGPNA
jgi:hypothetical protein